MSGWDEAEEATKNSGAGGDFLKLEDGQSAVIAIYGEPQHYLAKPFAGKPNARPSTKVLLRVFNMTTKSPQIWDMAGATFKALLEVTGTPKKPAKFPMGAWSHTVKRSGTGTKTRYTILPDSQLNDAQKKFLAGLPADGLAEVAEKIEHTDDEGGDLADSAPAQHYQRPVAAQFASADRNGPPAQVDNNADIPF